ncbi:MAG: hypothetical protein WCF23_15495 [Candidatus Nitrosopolaris sp.]
MSKNNPNFHAGNLNSPEYNDYPYDNEDTADTEIKITIIVPMRS